MEGGGKDELQINYLVVETAWKQVLRGSDLCIFTAVFFIVSSLLVYAEHVILRYSQYTLIYCYSNILTYIENK